jgi:DNA-binding response OmpR family regulator
VEFQVAERQVSLRVMLVDSNVHLLASFAKLLEVHGHSVRTAISCKEALAVTEGYRPEAVFTGIALFLSSGFELTRRLRARTDCVNAVIVAMTGRESELTPEQWTYAGFDRVLHRPTDIHAIVDVLRAISISRRANVRLVQ